jgi:hypothetical protein
MDKLYDRPLKAIRKNCLECSGSPKEVRLCPVIKCPLYAYRMGTRPSQETLDTLEAFYEENPELA